MVYIPALPRSGGYGHHGSIDGHGHHVKGFQSYAVTAQDDECCPPVVDPLTLGTILAGIAAATVVFRQLVISNIMGKRKKRSDGPGDKVPIEDRFQDFINLG